MRTRAFTLVEMLLVVTLIGLLIALLLPSLSRAKEITRRTICANNLHQLHTGYIKYAVDHRRFLPLTGHNYGTGGEGYWIETQLANLLEKSYLGTFEIYYCPSALLRGYASYPSQAARPTAKWWWTDWQILANHYEHRVTGYGATTHLNAAMPDELRVRRTSDDTSLAMLYDGNERGPNTTLIPGWSWRVSHDDGITGPEGSNRANLAGDVRWIPYADMKGRWFNGGVWHVWW